MAQKKNECIFGKISGSAEVNFWYKYGQIFASAVIHSVMFSIPFLNEAVLKWIKKHPLDDQIDRLNYLTTTILLLLFSLIVSAKQYIGSPLQCWIPQDFTNAYEEYAENYCFVHGTYYFSSNKSIDLDVEKRRGQAFGYYQWVPFLLVLQAFFFYFPNMIWKKLNFNSEWDRILNKTLLLRTMYAKEDYEKAKKETIEKLVDILEVKSEDKMVALIEKEGKQMKAKDAIFPSIACNYLMVKILYNINIVLQFLFLVKFLGKGNIGWGWSIASSIYMHQDSEIFPRVTLCDFSVREMGNVHHHTIQCVLMVNTFNEKIFLFLWIWLIILGILTFGNTLWIFAILWFQKMWRIFIRQNRLMDLNRDKILFLRFFKNQLPNWIYSEITSELFQHIEME